MKESGNDLGHLLEPSHHAIDHGFQFFLGPDGGLVQVGLLAKRGKLAASSEPKGNAKSC
jgi:hypothetical protein